MKNTILVLALLLLAWSAAASNGATNRSADLQGTAEATCEVAQPDDHRERVFTVNTDPLVMCLGFYYLTLDVVLNDHLILGNAIGFRNGHWALIPALRDDTIGISYTLGLAWFPFGSGA